MRIFVSLFFIVLFQMCSAQSLAEKEKLVNYVTSAISLSNINKLEKYLIENSIYEYIPLADPLKGKGRISSPFGTRIHPISHKRKFHSGVDIAVELGSRVYSSATGVVVFSGRKGGYGRCVIIRHKFGFETRYAHLAAYYTRQGKTIKAGEVIGFVGSTGISTGNHLHYEVRKFGKPIKPLVL